MKIRATDTFSSSGSSTEDESDYRTIAIRNSHGRRSVSIEENETVARGNPSGTVYVNHLGHNGYYIDIVLDPRVADRQYVGDEPTIYATALIDTGSAVTIMDYTTWSKISVTLRSELSHCETNLRAVNHSPIPVKGQSIVRYLIRGQSCDYETVILEPGTMPQQVILGQNFLNRFQLGFVYAKHDNKCWLTHRGERIQRIKEQLDE